MSLIDLVGSAAATLTTVSFIPQVLKTLKTRDTKSISLMMYSLFVLGIALWLVWGLFVNQLNVILANGITLILTSIVLVMKIRDVLSMKE